MLCTFRLFAIVIVFMHLFKSIEKPFNEERKGEIGAHTHTQTHWHRQTVIRKAWRQSFFACPIARLRICVFLIYCWLLNGFVLFFLPLVGFFTAVWSKVRASAGERISSSSQLTRPHSEKTRERLEESKSSTQEADCAAADLCSLESPSPHTPTHTHAHCPDKSGCF